MLLLPPRDTLLLLLVVVHTPLLLHAPPLVLLPRGHYSPASSLSSSLASTSVTALTNWSSHCAIGTWHSSIVVVVAAELSRPSLLRSSAVSSRSSWTCCHGCRGHCCRSRCGRVITVITAVIAAIIAAVVVASSWQSS